MKHCQFCQANFANEDAYQIYLGIGAPAFHQCLDANEMTAKGMQQKNGLWRIDESLIVYHQGWASLKSEWAPGHPPAEPVVYNREMDERNRIAMENREKPWLPLHDGE